MTARLSHAELVDGGAIPLEADARVECDGFAAGVHETDEPHRARYLIKHLTGLPVRYALCAECAGRYLTPAKIADAIGHINEELARTQAPAPTAVTVALPAGDEDLVASISAALELTAYLRGDPDLTVGHVDQRADDVLVEILRKLRQARPQPRVAGVEVEPLAIVGLDPAARDATVSSLRMLADPNVDEDVHDFAVDLDFDRTLLGQVAALLELDHGSDLGALHRLDAPPPARSGPPARSPEAIDLDVEEAAVYRRVIERILGAAGGPLARFAYLGEFRP